jgi:hypothetical protein
MATMNTYELSPTANTRRLADQYEASESVQKNASSQAYAVAPVRSSSMRSISPVNNLAATLLEGIYAHVRPPHSI